MNFLTYGRIALVCVLACAARAEPQKPATPPASTQPVAAKPAAPGAATPAATPAAMSESKYLSLLYSEISRHTPDENVSGPGEVTASFVIGPSGKVDKVTIDKTSSAAHAEIVKKILSEVVTLPPPGGSMDVGQTFKFR